MLYLDSSALVKRYFQERGSKQLQNRLNKGDRLFTSDLTYAEVHAAMGRKYHAGDMDRKTFLRLRNRFTHDWLFSLSSVEVNPSTTMIRVPELVERFRLTGGDAIQLAAAVWLRDSLTVGVPIADDDVTFEFGVADARLAEAAARCGLSVFSPESED
jgi:predicted nucleic acid-binding protein